MTSKRSQHSGQQQRNTVRIIGGEWRRRRLPVHDSPGLRPTSDRVRETLFNWLMPHIHGAHCLDLFAGTGALGLEALSRGASFVQFFEKHNATVRQLQTNLDTLHCATSRYALHHGDGIQWLSTVPKQHFDIVFFDPPFANNLWQTSCDAIEQSACLRNRALIYVESTPETKITVPTTWQIHKTLTAGGVQACLYENITE